MWGAVSSAVRRLCRRLWAHSCIARAPHSTFRLLFIKHNIKLSNLCAQHATLAELRKSNWVTCVCIHALRGIVRLTLVLHGQLLRVLGATKLTHISIITRNILLIIVLIRTCNPFMCKQRGRHGRVHIPNSRGHTEGWKSPYPQLKGLHRSVGESIFPT